MSEATNPLVRKEVLEERAYQRGIADEAIRRNTLVVLPTALGKTAIAALVASHFLYNHSDMKVIVMAPTRPLVLQHRDTFMRLLKLRPQDVQVLTGRHPASQRMQAWSGPARIYFATPQVVNNDHKAGLKLRDFSLLVFDECMAAGTLVLMEDGSVKEIAKLRNGESVVGGRVSEKFSRVSEDLYLVRTNFSDLVVTGTHPHLTIWRKGNWWRWRECKGPSEKDIKISLTADLDPRNCYLLVPKEIPHRTVRSWSPEQLKFVALIACDGHIEKKKNVIKVSVRKQKQIQWIRKTFMDGLRSFGENRFWEFVNRRGDWTIGCSSKKIKKILIKKFHISEGKKSSLIDIPNEVFYSPLDSIKSFIDGCFSSEGWLDMRDRVKKIYFSSNSERFVTKLQLLLKKFGVHSYRTLRRRRVPLHKSTYFVYVAGPDFDRLQDIIEFSRLELNSQEKCGPYMRNPRKSEIRFSGRVYRLAKVLEAKKLNDKRRVYDFTSQETHTFIANGCLTHNCHRARKNYSYTRVAEAYVNESPHPIILGLTASPGADRKRIEEICRALYIERVEARTEEDSDVMPYVSHVSVDWKFVRLPESYNPIKAALREMLDGRLQKLSSLGVIRKNPKYIFRTDLLKAGEGLRHRMNRTPMARRGPLYGILIIQSSALTLYHALELLESQGPHTLKRFLDKVRTGQRASHKGIASELASRGVYDLIDSGSLEDHPKMGALKRVLAEQLSNRPASKVIVFTQYRDTSTHIVSELSGLSIPTARFVGQADKAEDAGLSQEQQASLLERFRDGDLKVLVATSIGEEGLDIPSVDLVVFYEPVPSEIRYIQRKGRTGRRSFGKVVILAAEGTLDVSYLKASRKMAERMKSIVKGLNTELKQIIRLAPIPERNPMSMEVISEAEECPPPSEIAEEEPGRRKQVSLKREVRALAKDVFEHVLRAGREGVSVAWLTGEFEGSGVDNSTLKAAVDTLRRENQVKVSGDRVFLVGADVAGSNSQEVHTFEVEKVLPGRAVLSVDGKWRAVLLSEEFEGPRQLIKKGRRFRAAAKLYKSQDTLHAKIYAVEAALD